MKLALTDIGIRNAAAPAGGQLDLWDTSFKGGRFGVRVSRGGSKTFMLKYRDRRVTLGRFPVLSLADARGEARRIIAEFTLGKPPSQRHFVRGCHQPLPRREEEDPPRTNRRPLRMAAWPLQFQGQPQHDHPQRHRARRCEGEIAFYEEPRCGRSQSVLHLGAQKTTCQRQPNIRPVNAEIPSPGPCPHRRRASQSVDSHR